MSQSSLARQKDRLQLDQRHCLPRASSVGYSSLQDRKLRVSLQDKVLQLLSAQQGHFLLESGHHGDVWFDLETLCLHPRRVREVADELARLVSSMNAEVICGPLVEGAFVGLMVALQLNLSFVYSERFARPAEGGLFPAGYRIPAVLRPGLRGKRVAIVNDVINAGSAVRGTFADLEECGASVVGIGALLVLGTAASEFVSSKSVPLVSVATMPNHLWTPQECPLCPSGMNLQDIADFSTHLPKVSAQP
jgi:orotate phosphoribosyltransferase